MEACGFCYEMHFTFAELSYIYPIRIGIIHTSHQLAFFLYENNITHVEISNKPMNHFLTRNTFLCTGEDYLNFKTLSSFTVVNNILIVYVTKLKIQRRWL